ncbi:MAG: methyl-accepting chemotaxis protein [Hyphomicrobiales bacterium]|nr:methyl-accepting chemotaxis protein [Hyphomicrobiales bacterium]
MTSGPLSKAGPPENAVERTEGEAAFGGDEPRAAGIFAADPPADAPVDIGETFKLIEGDINRVITKVVAAYEAVRQQIGGQLTITEAVRSDTLTLASMTDQVSQNAAMLASIADELATSSEHVGRQVDETEKINRRANEAATNAGSRVAELRRAADEIGDVVQLIAAVARQTNLLALNATIEAARAGAAGRGFVVVANEVKALSVQTQKATDEIAAKIAFLQRSAQGSISAVDEITETIADLEPIFGTVADAVRTEILSSNTIRENAAEMASFIGSVSELAGDILGRTENAHAVGEDVSAAAQVMSREFETMRQRFTMLIRQTKAADRQMHNRLPVEIRGKLAGAGKQIAVTAVDISPGGVLVKPDGEIALANGARVTITLDEIGALEARIVTTSDLGLHAAFMPGGGEAESRLLAFIERLNTENRPLIELAQIVARRIGECFEAGVAEGRVSIGDLFDTDYRPIPETDPVQYRTRSLGFLESVLPAILYPLPRDDPRIAYVGAVDFNGYLPVHEPSLSKPQRKGEFQWNVVNSRNRRILDDRNGLAAARNTRPYLIQSYPRDLGGGRIVIRKEIDAPIHVNGRHWGAVRCSFKQRSELAI